MIVKSDSQRVFGGFTRVKWDSSAFYVADKNAFLFSVDRKEKYPIKENFNFAIYLGKGLN